VLHFDCLWLYFILSVAVSLWLLLISLMMFWATGDSFQDWSEGWAGKGSFILVLPTYSGQCKEFTVDSGQENPPLSWQENYLFDF